jgi:hypothetical protein
MVICLRQPGKSLKKDLSAAAAACPANTTVLSTLVGWQHGPQLRPPPPPPPPLLLLLLLRVQCLLAQVAHTDLKLRCRPFGELHTCQLGL